MRHPIETPLREMVDQQDTLPLPVVKLVYVSSSGLLTLRQVRERCGLNQVQLARMAGVRPIVVDWCERGRAVRPGEAAQILAALARCSAACQRAMRLMCGKEASHEPEQVGGSLLALAGARAG